MAINRDKVYDGAIKLLQASKYDKAIIEFQKLIAEDGKDVRTLLKIAETLHVKMGKRKEALEHYDRAANIYAEQGFFLKAVAVFKQMLTVDATNPDMHLRLAELYQQLGYGSQCLLHYQQVVVLYEQQERGKDTLGILKRMVDLDPENLQSRIKVAELFAQSGQMQEANAEIRSAFEFLKGQQRLDDAVRVGEKVLAWDPNASDVARDLANIYMARNDAKQALPKLQMCFKVDPRNLEVLDLIAKAFLALDQTPKTISVYKEMARIYEGNNDTANARASWERVLDLKPGDDDAEIALGNRAATVVAMAVAPATGASRVNAEDEQLARLLTETDVYVKYGLRDKAIEHLDKIFAIRPEHIPGLEKLKQLQTQTKQPTLVVDTLKRLIVRGDEASHPKVPEWKAELVRAEKALAPSKSQPTPVAPRRKEASNEGEVILVEEEPVAAFAATLPSMQALQALPKRASTARGTEPLDPPTRMQPSPNMLASVASTSAQVGARPGAAPFTLASPLDADDDLLADEPLTFDSSNDLPPDEDLSAVPAATRRPSPAPSLASPPPPSVLKAEEVVLEEALDPDALVREALGINELDLPEAGSTAGWPPPMPSSEEGHPADELVLEQEDAPSATVYGTQLATTSSDTSALGTGFDDFELDALAAEAVRDAALPRSPLPAPAMSTALMGLSDDEVGELQKFVERASSEGPALYDDESDFSEHTATHEWPGATPSVPPESGTPVMAFDDEQTDRSARPAKSMAVRPDVPTTPPNDALVDPLLTNEFDPNDFDLPSDVKAMLGSPAVNAPVGFGHSAGGDDVTRALPLGSMARRLDSDIPSLASGDAEAVIDMDEALSGGDVSPSADFSAEFSAAELSAAGFDDVDGGVAESGNVAGGNDFGDEALDAPSQSRNLFQVARGFEDDPANTFFPDELAEAEFFIQQDLLEEAREILAPILEEIEDSLRVQHMLARVAAKEAGEPEPPAPWEQKLIDEVGAQLDDLAALSPPLENHAPHQVSVEDVLSQFKKGVAETVPEDDAATHYDLGIAYREMGLLEDAVSEFEIAARAPGRAADSYYVVGLVRLEQGRPDDALAALERAFHSASASKDQKAAAEYERGVIFDEHKNNGREGLVCFKRSKLLGCNVPDVDRRIAALTKVHGEVDVPSLNGSPAPGGHSKSPPAPSVGRPKNIDYV